MFGRLLMNIFSGLEKIVEEDYPLSEHTWYGLGGPAKYFIRPSTTEELAQVMNICSENNIEVKVLGFGSNLLVSDNGVNAAVIKLDGKQFNQTEFNETVITAWAGADLSKLVLTCVEKGLAGIETLTGIPGSIGGAIRMNAGGRFGDIGSVTESVTLMDAKGGIFQKSKPELIFDYRSTNIKAPVILSAKLQLYSSDPEQIMRTLQESWIFKKNTQPLNTRNSGCVFKNPPNNSAGALIDRAGLKGLQIGQAVISDKHANFIVAQKGCTSRDITRLIDAVKQRIKEQFDIELETELEIWE
jgi:UDP-N-acetylmuramate dehydrogenase